VVDELFTYMRVFGGVRGFISADGKEPASWRHFNYGLAHIARERARERLGTFSAVSASRMTKQADRQDWIEQVSRSAGPGWEA
jgi:hypothetical protein